jgi:hypothetical protein
VIGDETSPFELDVGVSTEGRLDGDDRVQPGTIPAGTYAILVHEGDPDGLPERHAVLEPWAETNGHELARRTEDETSHWKGRYEYFQTDPTQEPDRSKWIIEITNLLRDGFPEELSAPTRRALAGAGYSRLEQLDGVDAAEVETFHGIEPSVLEKLRHGLESVGGSFADRGIRP